MVIIVRKKILNKHTQKTCYNLIEINWIRFQTPNLNFK